MGTVEEYVRDARRFIDRNPEINTSSFSLTREEYTDFAKLYIWLNGEGYRIIGVNLDLNRNKHEVVLSSKRHR